MKTIYYYISSITLFITIIFSQGVYAQTGPGGIGNPDGNSDLILWLDASTVGNTTSLWKDISGYGRDLNDGLASYSTDVNGYNSYGFDGTQTLSTNVVVPDLMVETFSILSSVQSGILTGTEQQAVYGTYDQGRGFIFYNFDDGSNKPTLRTAGLSLEGLIENDAYWSSHSSYHYTDNDHYLKLFKNNILNSESSKGSSYVLIDEDRKFVVGAQQDGGNAYNHYFQGRVSEIIYFNRRIFSHERTIINNYLAAKYDYTLANGDIYTGDDDARGNFDHNVAGIGEGVNGKHENSQGTGIIRINNPSSLDDGDYLFWGEDVIGTTYNLAVSPTSPYQYTLGKQWAVSMQGDVGTVDLQFKKSDVTNIGSAPGGFNWVLAVSKNNIYNPRDPSFDVTYYDLTDTGTEFKATVQFVDGDYFRIESTGIITLDDISWHNGSGDDGSPSILDFGRKVTVLGTADGTPSLAENAIVDMVEIISGGKLVVNGSINFVSFKSIINDGEIELNTDSRVAAVVELKNNGLITFTGNGGVIASPVINSSGAIIVDAGKSAESLGIINLLSNANANSGIYINQGATFSASMINNADRINISNNGIVRSIVNVDGGTIGFAVGVDSDNPGNSTIDGTLNIINGDINLVSKTNVIVGEVNVASGSSIAVKDGARLTVQGNIDNGGDFIIESKDITSTGTGLLITNGTVKNNGTMTVQRRIDDSKSKWQLVSSPVEDAVSGIFKGHFLNWYDEGPGDFHAISAVDHAMGIGEGFVVKFAGDKGVQGMPNPMLFNGAFNTDDVDVALVPGVGNTWFDLPEGFNFVGNPYPSNLDWDMVKGENSAIDATYYYYVDTGNGEGTDITPGTGGTNGWQTYTSGAGGANQNITIGQGFGVVATGNIGGTLHIPNKARTFAASNGFNKKQKTKSDYFELNAVSNNIIDKIYFHENNEATTSYDGKYDAYKLNSFGASPTPSFVSADNKKLAVCETPFVESINMGFIMSESGEVEFSLKDVEGFSEIILEDKLEGKYPDLTEENYVFQYTSEGSKIDKSKEFDRFTLHFTKEALTEPEELVSLKIYTYNNSVFIESPIIIKNVSVKLYSLTGQLTFEKHYSSLKEKEIRTNMKKGVYLLEVTSEKGKITQKISL